jgi:hypothetical protein
MTTIPSIPSISPLIGGNMSICLISLEEHHHRDGNSNIEILIENRLPPSLDSILDKNTQLLFDQDQINTRIFIARSLDSSAVLGLLSCIRNIGWHISASNGLYFNDIQIRKFYFEKLFDLSKIVLVEPLKSKRNSRMAFHFDSSASTSSSANSSSNSVSTKIDSSEVSDRAVKLAEFSRAVERATQEAVLKTNTADEEPPRPILKPRRSSISEGKPSIVFKQLAERRKISTNSSHPLDPKFSTPEDRDVGQARVLNRASSSPPPLGNAVPFSSVPPESTSGETAIQKKKGTVSGLANMFANHQFMHQPGGPPPTIKKKHGLHMVVSKFTLTRL